MKKLLALALVGVSLAGCASMQPMGHHARHVSEPAVSAPVAAPAPAPAPMTRLQKLDARRDKLKAGFDSFASRFHFHKKPKPQ